MNWKADIERLSTQHSRRPDVVFTTFFDLYGMPSDFPNLDVHRSEKNTIRRASALEAEIAKQIDERRLIPYVQRHEFEALVLACLDELDEWLDKADRRGIAKLRAEIDGTAPEDVNDGATTAPSKRILRCIPVFRKSVHGVEACELAGVAKLRARCPRFDAWVAKLEALGSVLP